MLSVTHSLAGLFLAATLAACGDDSPSAPNANPGTDAQKQCSVRFAVTNRSIFANLEALVDFSAAPGSFVGFGGNVECERIDDRLTVYGANWNCDEGQGCYAGKQPVLRIHAFSNHDFESPVDLLECRFSGSDVPREADFATVQLDASDDHYQQADPLPVVDVTSIDCQDATATTTSTTLPDPCEGVSCQPGNVCKDSLCTSVTAYEIDFGVDTLKVFGALQYDVHYDCLEGGFDGERDDVLCTGFPPLNAFVNFNDRICDPVTGLGRLTSTMVSLAGAPGPTRLATCIYISTDNEPPSPARFQLSVVDASDRNLQPIYGASVSVHAIRPVAR